MYPQHKTLEFKLVRNPRQDPIDFMAWTNDSQDLLLSSGTDWNHTMTRHAIDSSKIFENVLRDTYFGFSASPTKQVVALIKETGVELFNYELLKPVIHLPTLYYPSSVWAPMWSRDGLRVAFTSHVLGGNSMMSLVNQLTVVHHDGSQGVSATDSRPMLGVSWSANDALLAVQFPHQETMTVTAEKLRFAQWLLDKPGFTFGPQPGQGLWWENYLGSQILHLSRDPDWENTETVTAHSLRGERPEVLWSPDGKRLLIIEGRDAAKSVLVYELAKRTVELIPHDWLIGAKHFRWSPDSKAFACITQSGRNALVCYLD